MQPATVVEKSCQKGDEKEDTETEEKERERERRSTTARTGATKTELPKGIVKSYGRRRYTKSAKPCGLRQAQAAFAASQ